MSLPDHRRILPLNEIPVLELYMHLVDSNSPSDPLEIPSQGIAESKHAASKLRRAYTNSNRLALPFLHILHYAKQLQYTTMSIIQLTAHPPMSDSAPSHPQCLAASLLTASTSKTSHLESKMQSYIIEGYMPAKPQSSHQQSSHCTNT